MIALFTDYGLEGPYLGQVEVVLRQQAPDEEIITLMADAPRNDPKASAYLLSAITCYFDKETIFLSVVDPGVGAFRDEPVILKLNKHWYVGPDNGLFDIVCRRSVQKKCWRIDWRPEMLSNSFHGRDLYAPVAAMLSNDDIPGTEIKWQDRHGWPDDLNEIIYIDHFGNCMTGIRAEALQDNVELKINGRTLAYADTFSSVPQNAAFWYRNSQGLIEIAVNGGSAAEQLDLQIGSGSGLKFLA